MILLLDNKDSFVHTLARYVGLLGYDRDIVRSDAVTLDAVKDMDPEAILISPGPCTPAQAGISTEAVRRFGAEIPILGVCLGHQCIAEAYGGNVYPSGRPVHGKASQIHHDGTDLFEGLENPFMAGRYHSLIADVDNAPGLRVTARDEHGIVMALAHRRDPVYGVQFHPESVMTEQTGLKLMTNFFRNTLKGHENADLV